MVRIAEPKEIYDFLNIVKKVASRPNRFDLVPRRENLNALAEMGLPRSAPRNVVRSLTIRNYCFTDEDRDRTGEVWVFGKGIYDEPFYIKLKLDQIDGLYIVKCLSFHPEKPGSKPLMFPYQSP